MIRINLLPKEILERRKYERFYPWVAIAAGAVLAAIFIWYAVLALQVGAGNREYQQSANTARELQTQAKAFFVFEEKEKQLAERRQVVDVALKGRVPWGKLANEVSLVLPSEAWLTQFMGSQSTDQSPYGSTGTTYIGFPAILTLIGDTPDTDPKSMSEGYKSLAKTLVRLNDLSLLNNTWLTSSAIGSYPESVGTDEKAVNVQLFTITSSVVLQDVAASTSTTPTGSSAAPAPPSSAGQ